MKRNEKGGRETYVTVGGVKRAIAISVASIVESAIYVRPCSLVLCCKRGHTDREGNCCIVWMQDQ